MNSFPSTSLFGRAFAVNFLAKLQELKIFCTRSITIDPDCEVLGHLVFNKIERFALVQRVNYKDPKIFRLPATFLNQTGHFNKLGCTYLKGRDCP